MDIDYDPALLRSSRKHSRSSDLDDDVSDWSSDISGRFDDAAEEPELEDYRSSEEKPAKRRRSNDWPLPEQAADYGHQTRRAGRGGYALDGPGAGAGYKGSPRASPRASLASLRGRTAAALTSSPRVRLGRRSRFVEANMSDSISEEPPSIFVQEAKPTGPRHRPSGIFRFGKAIASAFNPFGAWSRPNPPPPKDALTRAEEAYAELKRAGYQGTNKGSYLQSQASRASSAATTRCAVDPNHADQTWHALSSKFNCGADGSVVTGHASDRDEFPTPSRSTSKSSKRSSFQELRSIGIPFVRYHDPSSATSVYQERTSEESVDNTTGLRKQRSRKEISRQTKLLKKVSNLEDKLERARRELRQLSGNEERIPSTTPDQKSASFDMDPASYPRRFVPGALPTLPSERLLDQHATDVDHPDARPSEITALPPVEERENFSPGPSRGTSSKTVSRSPSRQHGEVRQPSMSKTSTSRKRKSPDPEHFDSRHSKPRESDPSHRLERDTHRDSDSPLKNDRLDDGLIDFTLSPPRRAKWQKNEAGDSPRSVERKRHADRDGPNSIHHDKSPISKSQVSSPAPVARSPHLQSVRSPAPTTGPTSLSRGPSSLRFTSPASTTRTIPESPAVAYDDVFSSSPAFLEMPHTFYLQSHCQLDPDRTPVPSPTKPQPMNRKRRRHDSSDIPPVPPLPKELLLQNQSQVHGSPTKRMTPTDPSFVDVKDDKEPPEQGSLAQSPRLSFLENYPWPEDIF
ncbi:hypothetical protein PDE_00651 [Penicillium oxalicum 114-2]|uniref:Nuclear RNA binding protein n=1 Tax=Penicillium oxalicum (strain 114-2 / CGMCC 5302) TaxID=933388 RepID=S8AV33_PENO1|nr:hypothetical protein PDE_00651 [Penicillium oxalicum 114-2]